MAEREHTSSWRRRLVLGTAFLCAGLSCLAVIVDVRFVEVPGRSMAPTLGYYDDVVAWSVGGVERGDVVLYMPNRDYARPTPGRIVGLAGEVVSFDDDQVFIDDVPLPEDYLDPETESWPLAGGATTFVIPSDHVFVMGDNRTASVSDSRAFGPVHIDAVVSTNVWIRNRAHDNSRVEWLDVYAWTVTADIPAGTPFDDLIAAGYIQERSMDGRDRPANFINDYTKLEGVAVEDIPANSVLVDTMFAKP